MALELLDVCIKASLARVQTKQARQKKKQPPHPDRKIAQKSSESESEQVDLVREVPKQREGDAAGGLLRGKAAEEEEKKRKRERNRQRGRETENQPRQLPKDLGSGKRSQIGESTAMPRRKQQAPKRAAGKKPIHSLQPSASPWTCKPSPPPPHFILGSPFWNFLLD